jgi:UDP-glucose 4-epimerase
MNFLVTGGAGFIGSHVIEKLLEENHKITVIDNLTTGYAHNLPTHPNLQLISRNVIDCCREDFNESFDGLAHLSATPSVTQSWQQPLITHENNTSATIAAIQLCQALEIPRFVFTSSAAVYGNPQKVPITEDSPTIPISPYGLHKLIGEQYLKLFIQQFGQQIGWSAVNLRLFNVFGPRQDPSSPYSGVISIFMKAMRQNLPISIYGDGTQTRDFLYVQDVASAFLNALTAPLPAGSCTTCNVGTGQSVSLLELVQSLNCCFPNWTPDIQFHPSRPGDIQHSLADVSKADLYLGFKSKWTLESGLRHFAQYLIYEL